MSNNNPFTTFFKKYNIDAVKITRCHGWNHSRPAIGFFSEGNEIANIHDSAIHYLNDGYNCTDQDGNESDYKDENVIDAAELHSPVVTATVSNFCGLYMEEDEYQKARAKDITDDCAEMNVWLDETESFVNVYFKKDGKEIDWEDTYEQFINDMFTMIKPELTEAINEANKENA